MNRPFSVVIPVKDEADLMRRTLPSWCELKPDELILCFDKPANKDCVEIAEHVAKVHSTKLRIVEVENNPEYKFQQAWIRRKGFLTARNDVILTGDIDLRVFSSCLKAVELVGKNDVGLVSLSKYRFRKSLIGRLRALLEKVTRIYGKTLGKQWAGLAYFTGLYAIHRPFWLDSEDVESIKGLENPKTAPLSFTSWGGYVGEDSHLRDFMVTTHRVLYLLDIGAEDLRPGLEDTKQIQCKIGLKFAYEGRSPLHPLRHSLIHLRPFVLGSYIHRMSVVYGGALRAYFAVYKCFMYLLIRIMLRLFMNREKRNKSLVLFSGIFPEIVPLERLSFKMAVKHGRHELPVSLRVKRLKGELFIDIGADKGYYSFLLCNNFKKVIAFEPGDSIKILKDNIRQFKTKNVEAIKKAVYDFDGEAVMYRAEYKKYNVCVAEMPLVPLPIRAQFHPEDHKFIGETKVDCVCLSSFLKDVSLVDLIKVDVEGAEWNVLKGAEAVMKKIKRWVVELHQPWRKKELEQFFRERGYSFEWLTFGKLTSHIYAWRKQ